MNRLNEGGFAREKGFQTESFFSTLRYYPQIRASTPSKDYFARAQSWKKDKEKEMEKTNFKIMRDMLTRLTQPRTVTYKAIELRKLNPPKSNSQDLTYMGHKLDKSFY
jgi:benzoyl-CoA reductase/2-hydroxyglutaryl-CoA dehydratase subunit BcrC/BadD/HgdB